MLERICKFVIKKGNLTQLTLFLVRLTVLQLRILIMKKNILLTAILNLIFCNWVNSQVMNVNPSNNATQLAQSLVGNGVTISNATLNCGSAPSGSVNYGGGLFNISASPNVLGMDSGIVLTSGRCLTDGTGAGVNIIPPNVAAASSNTTGNGGDPDLTAVIGGATFDKCILEFDFITIGDSVKFDYVFTSSEYQNWTCTSFNDVFGFFLSGPGITGPYSNSSINIALVPGSTTCPVGVSTIFCPNMPGCCQTTNYCFGNTPGCGMFNAANNTCNLFVCNTGGTLVKYQGFTKVLTAKSAVVPCSTYHIKLAIADKADQILDSGVFLKAKSFTSDPIDLKVETGLSALNPYIIEGCDTAKLKITRQLYAGVPVNPDTVQFVIAGTATNSVDYNTMVDSIIFTGNGGAVATSPTDTTIEINLWAFNDGITEGTEIIKIYVVSGCFNTITDSITLEIRDSLNFILNTTNSAICLGQSVNTTGTVDPGLLLTWSPPNLFTNPNNVNSTVTPNTFGTQTFIATTTYLGCPPAIRSFSLTVDPVPVITPLPDIDVCEGRTAAINAIVTPPFNYNLNWNPSTNMINTNGYNPTYLGNANGNENITFTVTSPNANCTISDTFSVVNHPFAVGSIIDSTLDCSGNPVPLWVAGGNGNYQWYPYDPTQLSCEFCSNPVSTAYGTTVYNAILLNPYGCQDTLTTVIESHPPFTMNLLNNDTTIFAGESVQINVAGNAPHMYWTPTRYLNFSQSNNPIATPMETTNYHVTGVSLFQGCPKTDSFKITVLDPGVFVPNVFTPNGDNLNDVFRVRGGKLDKVQEFRIFNRWGREIFTTRDMNLGWDGKFKGIPQDSGTFFYLIRMARPNGTVVTLKGEFILMR